MCEMKSSCPVPRGSVQHTEQCWGRGGGCEGVHGRGGPQHHMGTLTQRGAVPLLQGRRERGLSAWEQWVAAVGLEAVGGTALLDQALAVPPARRPSPAYPPPPPRVLVSRCSAEIIKSAVLAGSASPARRIRNQPREGRGLSHLRTPSRPPHHHATPAPGHPAWPCRLCLPRLPACRRDLPACTRGDDPGCSREGQHIRLPCR